MLKRDANRDEGLLESHDSNEKKATSPVAQRLIQSIRLVYYAIE
jgi:hypothetical protein